ncbi:MAG: histidine--tRNA ligase [Pegethrix bostrychoides GSE-TBD4-15B]|jgi:histidyl-tRNA synthetase|uniref:Histidine--tRNA ligase n=1 Tax=Pegethrix bostrychoides GSE-TBD4-15B TaxID=2839662 RepID=A0A951U6M5_9CYAN|nr:histidine--tRNA ligase [Pegethrix bostrychoides GSE-TBD4-15B]
MTATDSLNAIKGTRDILPEEVAYWQWIEQAARQIFSRAAYREIRTPIFEQTELFARGIGEATDVVGKEMYTFIDKGDRSVTLRPEGTAGVVRAYIENGLHVKGSLQRLWYLGPMFRYENVQAGRQRQFHQLGMEVLGSADPRADVEVIALAVDLLNDLGLPNLRLDLNSVGTPEDRLRYRAALVDYLTPYQAELDPDSQNRLSRNPMRILDSKIAATQKIVEAAPKIWSYLAPDSQQRFERVQQQLTDLGIAYSLNPRLVRGLDYYTHTAFEIIAETGLGAQNAVGGGGRYDGLVSELGGPETAAVGWAMGLERLLLLLQQLKSAPASPLDFYIVSRSPAAEAQALRLAQALRHAGFATELDLSASAFGKQFKRADRSGAAGCLILGEAEAEAGTVQLKWLASGEQEALSQTDLLNQVETLRQRMQRSLELP